jgi:hypothetical protein
MPLAPCRECGAQVSTQAFSCPHCGAPRPTDAAWNGSGYEYKSARTVWGYPLVHVAFGRDSRGKRRVARGVIAIGQFAVGLVTVAQFGIGLLVGVGQFMAGMLVLAQFAGAVAVGIGQVATGYAAVGQVILAYQGVAQIDVTPYVRQALQFLGSWWREGKIILK